MALGVLNIIYIVLVIIAISLQVLLYLNKSGRGNSIFILNVVFAIILSYLAYTSLPTNYTSQRFIAIVLGVIPILGIFIKSKSKSFLLGSKLLLTVSILGTFLILFL